MKTSIDQTSLFRLFRDAWHARPRSQQSQGRGQALAASEDPISGHGTLRHRWGRSAHATVPLEAGSVSLPERKTLRVTQDSGIRRIKVQQGVVWLTSTPGGGDVLLRAGQAYELSAGGWPFVLEALSDVRADLLP